jgi:hypothetical protein
MKRILSILLLTIGMTLMGTVNARAQESRGNEPRQADFTKQQQPQAALFDARDYCSTSNVRPQRILPTYGPGKSNTRIYSLQGSYQLINLIFFYEDTSLLTAMISPIAPNDYYVIAMRRIVC